MVTAKLAALKHVGEDAQVNHRMRTPQLEEAEAHEQHNAHSGRCPASSGLTQPCEGASMMA